VKKVISRFDSVDRVENRAGHHRHNSACEEGRVPPAVSFRIPIHCKTGSGVAAAARFEIAGLPSSKAKMAQIPNSPFMMALLGLAANLPKGLVKIQCRRRG